MELLKRLNDEFKQAMKQRDKVRSDTLKMVRSELKNIQIERGEELTEEMVIKILNRQAKRRREAIQQYREGGRTELAEKEAAELEIIKQYLPEQLDEDELNQLIDQVIEKTAAAGPADMGPVMGQVMALVKGRAPGDKVNRMVAEKLRE